MISKEPRERTIIL